MYEQQKLSSVFSGEANNSEPLLTVGDVPAQTGAEDPQVSPTTPGTTNDTASTSN